jgi:N utilization substance protein B
MRRQSRELALQILFQTEFTAPIPYSEFLEIFEQSYTKDVIHYADQIISGVQKHKEEIDKLIQSASTHWTISRMAIVDRNILRLALVEMKWADDIVKPSVAINEAIEIAKRYGTTDSAHFVNGILDSIAKGF